jgi:hypothetical protein
MRRPLRCTAAVLALGLTLVGCGGDKKKSAPQAPVTAAASSSAPAASAAPTASASESPSASATAAASPSEPPAGEDGQQVVRASSAKVTAEGSAKFTMTMKAGPVVVQARGAQRFKAPVQARTTMSIEGAGKDVQKMDSLLTEKAMYIKFPRNLAAQLPGKKPWLKMTFADLEKAGGVDMKQLLEQSQQSSPDAYLKMLTAAGDIKQVGTKAIRGEQTTQYAGTIQPEDLAKAFTGKLREQYSTMLESMKAGPIKMDVWVAADGLPRRVHQVMTLQGQQMDMTMDLFDFGTKVDVQPPAAAQTTDMSELMKKSKG